MYDLAVLVVAATRRLISRARDKVDGESANDTSEAPLLLLPLYVLESVRRNVELKVEGARLVSVVAGVKAEADSRAVERNAVLDPGEKYVEETFDLLPSELLKN